MIIGHVKKQLLTKSENLICVFRRKTERSQKGRCDRNNPVGLKDFSAATVAVSGCFHLRARGGQTVERVEFNTHVS